MGASLSSPLTVETELVHARQTTEVDDGHEAMLLSLNLSSLSLLAPLGLQLTRTPLSSSGSPQELTDKENRPDRKSVV